MTLLDLLGQRPPRYDATLHRSSFPDPKKERTLAGHVQECAARYHELRTDSQDIRIELFELRRLIYLVIGLLVVNKVIDISQIMAVIAPSP